VPTAGILLLIPSDAPGRRIEHVWDTLGMRATCSENVLLEDCRISEEGASTARKTFPPSSATERIGCGPLTPRSTWEWEYPDVRRRVAEMSVDLEAARLMTYHSAWLSDTQGPTQAALAAMFRAKYFVGEAMTRITRTALTLGGAHAIFKTSPLERAFATEQPRRYSFLPLTFA